MAKKVLRRPEWLKSPQVVDVYSVSSCVSSCVSDNFGDYINNWRHNGYWLFDSPAIIRDIAQESSISLEGTSLFYYEVYDKEFDEGIWCPWVPEPSFATGVVSPSKKQFEGFDVVTFYVRTNPECSPLSCNSMADELRTNSHCLFETFEEAESSLSAGAFKDAEPGPYRIFSVYSVDWF